MICAQEEVTIRTQGSSLTNITADIVKVVSKSGVTTGLCHVFIKHTSASLIIQENADPAVLRDLVRWMAKVAPVGRDWEHDAEGPDDMPAHARAAITKTSEQVPVVGGRLSLGTWQGIFLWEHRERPHHRSLIVSVQGNR